MYKRKAQGWSKHLDFFLIDEISLQISFILAAFVYLRIWAYSYPHFKILGFLFVLVDALVLVFHNSMHGVIGRGYYIEALQTIKHCFLVFSIITIILFATKVGRDYSRITVLLAFVFYIVLGYGMRILWKVYIKKRHKDRIEKKRMLVVASPKTAGDILKRLDSEDLESYTIVGVVLSQNEGEKEVNGYPVVAEIEQASDYIVREWIDTVYIDAPFSDENVIKLMNDCKLMGVPTHYHVPNVDNEEIKCFPERIGNTTVLTTSINYATPAQVLFKRCFDIVAGLIGSVIALVIIAVVGPIIKKESPGPVLFTQERVGQNGRRFKMYKIRSMYMDAEERKKELMAQNRVKDGLMFKLDFDPRVIGNKILPDGTKKTGIGDFIRRTSLDEFPQFFCVLAGSMSTVGTRPPTVDEYLKYKYHHHARLATKPGITGMWQVSGRSDITDFEEVVRLDTEYITNWSPKLDLKILFKTIISVFSGKGAM